MLEGAGRGYLLSSWRECLQSPGVTWSCSCAEYLASSWCCPVAGCRLSLAPCPLRPRLPRARRLSTQGGANTSLGGALHSPERPVEAGEPPRLGGAVPLSPVNTKHLVPFMLLPPRHSKRPAQCPSSTVAAQADLGG